MDDLSESLDVCYGCRSLMSRDYRKPKENTDTQDSCPKEKSETNTEDESTSDEAENAENHGHLKFISAICKWCKKKFNRRRDLKEKFRNFSITLKQHSKEKQGKECTENEVGSIKFVQCNQENELSHSEEVHFSADEKESELRISESVESSGHAENGNAEDT